jgi:hypothetical protein
MDPASVSLVSAVSLSMPGGSLGCGDGAVSQQREILGLKIALEAAGLPYVYHSDGRKLLPCSPADFPGGRTPVYLSGPELDQSDLPTSPADLGVRVVAEKLSVPSGEVTVLSIEPVEWSDASLGCARPGQMYAQVMTPGYRVIVSARGATFEVHTGAGRAILCAGPE